MLVITHWLRCEVLQYGICCRYYAVCVCFSFFCLTDCVFDVCCFIVLTLPRAYNKDDDYVTAERR